jgi:transposase
MDIKSLCPDTATWQIVLIAFRPDRIVLHLEPWGREARCPICGTLSRRIHSRYLRHPWDLPWSCWPVQLYVITRRFFCDCPSCTRRIFSEPFPDLLEPYARQTNRLQNTLLEVSHIGSAEGASRMALAMNVVTSGDSLLRRQRKEQVEIPEPKIIGVDEFAFRRGGIYGTLIVDLERHRPIAVLDSDQADPFSEWLLAHPGIEIITRDRDEAYATAGRSAAPGARQVADRFHLVINVGEALKKLLQSRKWQIPVATTNPSPDTPAIKVAPLAPIPIPPSIIRNQAHWQAVHQRNREGYSMRAIARELRMSRNTVKSYLDMESASALEYRRALQPTKSGPYLTYLHKRWEEGVHDGRVLYREIVKLGYPGKLTQLYNILRPWRKAHRLQFPAHEPLPPLSRWVLRPRVQLPPEEEEPLEMILQVNPPLATGYDLKERFLKMIHQRDVGGLDAWLQEAANSGINQFRSLAASIKRDYEAVKNALILPWSNAQCEGQICRVKLIKRTGYGRAKMDLLRKRILHRNVTC